MKIIKSNLSKILKDKKMANMIKETFHKKI